MIFWLSLTLSARREGQLAGFLEDVAEVVVHHLQGQLLKQLLHARRVVDVRVVGDVAMAHRAQPVDQPRGEW